LVVARSFSDHRRSPLMPTTAKFSQTVGAPTATSWNVTRNLQPIRRLSFASLAAMPNFNSNKPAFLMLEPRPDMPSLSLSRAEIADIADFVATLK
jgi:hypothetical protein